ncbi:type II toxin-antitoxin system RelE/ParE family toxin [Frankia sp. CiP3]|uniref:type II toxin-antitoxin system RelE family toxin n=1 Tax=Frankia sp. CiP3 TaxID=2880971 RepID=UPI001EF6737A|nr:type II toxin-antitoxin system RelE/ParE family toxin [Frankia sp. CiP3]
MAYEIEWTTRALRELRKLDGVTARRGLTAVTQLSNDPRPHGVRALVGEPSAVFRLRVGAYRVVYHVEDARRRTLTTGEVASPLAGTPYDLRRSRPGPTLGSRRR